LKPTEFQKSLETGKIPSLVYLYGEEKFLLERTLEEVREKIVIEAVRDFNLSVFHARESAVPEILDAARTLPVLSSHRLVVVHDAHQFNASEQERFLDYLKAPCPETVLVFVGQSIDARRKFFQEFKKRGALVEFRRLYDNQIPAFVREQARAAGRSFTEEGLAWFCRRVGTNLQEVHAELIKLFTYLGERSLVDVEDVKNIVSDTREDSIFDLTNAVGQGQTGPSLRLLGRLLAEGEPPLRILTMLVRHFRQLWKAHELLAQNASRGEIIKRVKINPYFLDGLLAQARCFSEADFRLAFAHFLQTDLALKSSGAHPSALLEDLLLVLMKKTR